MQRTYAQPREPEPTEPETPWPHDISSGSLTVRVYQPQLEAWDGSLLKVRAAVSVTETSDAAPIFGIVEAQARTLVDYLKIFDGWMTSSSLTGSWSWARDPPPDLSAVLNIAVDSRQVDLLTGQTDQEQPGPTLAVAQPAIYVATTPSELIVTDGEPQWTPIPGTQLLFAQNTTGHVFKLVSDQKNDQTREQLYRDWSARSQGSERYAGRQASVRVMPRGGRRRR